MMSLTFATLALAALSGFVQGETCYCTEQYEPVCASNGKIFSNLCMMRCHNFNNHDNLQVAGFERCSQQQRKAEFSLLPPAKSNCFRRCPHTPLPVCGSDGVTYGSSCALDCVKTMNSNKQDVVEVHKGHCSSKLQHQMEIGQGEASDVCACNDDFRPVCGNNLHTYANMCDFECHAKKNSSLKLMYQGRCIIMP